MRIKSLFRCFGAQFGGTIYILMTHKGEMGNIGARHKGDVIPEPLGTEIAHDRHRGASMLLTSLARLGPEHEIRGDDDRRLKALRSLGSSIGGHRADVGGLQTLFWSGDAQGDAFLSGALGAVSDRWSDRSSPAVHSWLDHLETGRLRDILPAKGTFHVIGLSKNESELIIQFWITDTFVGLAERVHDFWEDLKFAPTGQRPAAVILQIVREAAFAHDFGQIAPRLTQDLLAAMLTGSDFPPRLLQTVVDQIRRDGEVDSRRAAVLKAILARRSRLSGGGRSVPVALDLDAPDPAYRFGRLFAVLDAIWALDGSETRPSAHFRSLAAAAPRMTALVASGLARLRLAAARGNEEGRRVMLRQEFDYLLRSVDHRLPSSLSAESRARFALGLFQQRQALGSGP